MYVYCTQGAKTLFPLQQKPCLAIEQVQTLFSRNGDLKVETDLTNFKVIKPEKIEISNLNCICTITSFCLGCANCMTIYVRKEMAIKLLYLRTKKMKTVP